MSLKHLARDIYLAARGAILGLVPGARPPVDIEAGSILFIRIDRIGDIIMSLPTIEAFRNIYPAAKISVMVKKENAPLLENVPFIDSVMPYEGFLRSIASIRGKKFDVVVDLLMDYTLLTALLTYFSGAGVRIGFDIALRGRLFSIAVKPDKGEKNMAENILDLAREAARFAGKERMKIPPARPELILKNGDGEIAISLLAESGAKKDGILIGIHPGAKFPSQRWGAEKFAELAERMIARERVGVVILGGRDDKCELRRMVRCMKTRVPVISDVPLDMLAALISRLDLLVCNNSGPLHIAAALGIPTVSTMGPTVEYLWRPIGDDHTVIRHAGASLDSITVDEMGEAVLTQLKKMRKQN